MASVAGPSEALVQVRPQCKWNR